MPPEILVTITLPPNSLTAIRAAFTVHYATTKDDIARTIAERGTTIRGVLASGSRGFSAAEIAALPKLELIAALGAGYENIDAQAAKARGIIVTHGQGTNAATVADHAMALLLSVTRAVPRTDRIVRAGQWESFKDLRPVAYGKRLGIVGLGRIGALIAKRASGFDMIVAYHNRTPRDVPYRYTASVLELARDSDFLVVATPGGPSTRHIVDRAVLKALGPNGFFINVARGSVVDTEALIAALSAGEIAGAALDVIDGEPKVPPALLEFPNVVITPHFGGRSPEAAAAGIQQAIDNLTAHFAGKPVLTPVR